MDEIKKTIAGRDVTAADLKAAKTCGGRAEATNGEEGLIAEERRWNWGTLVKQKDKRKKSQVIANIKGATFVFGQYVSRQE